MMVITVRTVSHAVREASSAWSCARVAPGHDVAHACNSRRSGVSGGIAAGDSYAARIVSVMTGPHSPASLAAKPHGREVPAVKRCRLLTAVAALMVLATVTTSRRTGSGPEAFDPARGSPGSMSTRTAR